jgi:hypothetical protein
MIKLRVTRFERNEDYQSQLDQYEKNVKGYFNPSREEMFRPEPNKVSSILEVEITEEHWERLRGAIIETYPSQK